MQTIPGCVTKPQVAHEIKLPPKPQREELKEPKNLKDIAEMLNYYEHLVERWEEWGDTVTIIVEETNDTGTNRNSL